jgi:alpha-D-xyloside xylohydrolase
MPVMRPLLFDFPEDKTVYPIFDEYMFGPDILVAPVIEKSITERSVYLPAGAEWSDPYSGKSYQGGETVLVPAPRSRMPLFLKNGIKLPIIAE